MSKEFLKDIGHKAGEGLMRGFMKLPDGVRDYLLAPVVCGVVIGSIVYSAVRGRSDSRCREAEMEYMEEEISLKGSHWLTRLPSVLWRGQGKAEAQRKIGDAEVAHNQLNAWFDSMSDAEMAAYARNHARQLRFLVLPAMAEGERRDN